VGRKIDENGVPLEWIVDEREVGTTVNTTGKLIKSIEGRIVLLKEALQKEKRERVLLENALEKFKKLLEEEDNVRQKH